LITDLYTPHVKTLITQFADDLVIPEFCLLECTNVLWKQVRFHGMPHSQALQLLHDLLDLPLADFPARQFMPQALKIGMDHQTAIYDALFIALANHLKIPLITADQKQALIATQEGVSLKNIQDFNP
jgi:predicted nucleic acid-binding protein